MVAILVDSRKDGETAWVATRGLAGVRVEGLAGCIVQMCCRPCNSVLEAREDGEIVLPEGTEFVQAVHIDANKESRVFVDLI